MTDTSNPSTPLSSQPSGAEPAKTGGAWRIGVAVVVVLLLAYPVVRVLSGGKGGDTATPAAEAGAAELQQALDHHLAGRYQESITAAQAALKANPNLADAYNTLAVSQMRLGKPDDAIAAVQQAIKLKPDFQLAKNNLAWFQREKGGVPPAENAEATALINQSMEHFQAGRFKECLDTAQQATKLSPSSPQAFNNAGFCAARLQQWDSAARYTAEALRLDPNFEMAKNNLAWIEKERKGGATK